MKLKWVYLFLLIIVACIAGVWIITFRTDSEKPLVVVIPSYNNSRWYKQNVQSVFDQQYNNYRVLYIDDCSPDGTGELVENFVKECGQSGRVQLIKNTERKGALANLYYAIHSCADQSIIITLDGDDWFKHDQVLATINKAYADSNILMTYGQFETYPEGHLGICNEYPAKIIQANAFRQYKWLASHLRTFYAWLFKRVQLEDLQYDDTFFPVVWDQAFMFPMLEMAVGRCRFINEVLYVYNQANPINDYKVRMQEIVACERMIRSKQKYEPLLTT